MMHDALNLSLSLLQEGDRQSLNFADQPAASAPAEASATVQQEGAADTTGTTAAPTGNSSFWIMILLLFLFMWFFIIRPENKRQKQKREFQSLLKKGDKVVMVSGLHGTVAALDEATVTIKVGDQLRLQFDRVAVARHASAPAEAEAKDSAKK